MAAKIGGHWLKTEVLFFFSFFGSNKRWTLDQSFFRCEEHLEHLATRVLTRALDRILIGMCLLGYSLIIEISEMDNCFLDKRYFSC